MHLCKLPHQHVHLTVCTHCRALQNPPAIASLPSGSAVAVTANLSAARLLVAAVMTMDAAAMDKCNQHEWGQRNNPNFCSRDSSSHACCPALWQVQRWSASYVLKSEMLCWVLIPASTNFQLRVLLISHVWFQRTKAQVSDKRVTPRLDLFQL